jgi:Poxvirus A32 protein
MEPEIKENEDVAKYFGRLPEWQPKEYFDKTIKQWKAFTCIISGSRMSGKSNMLKYLLKSPEVNLSRHFDFTIVFSRTLVNGFFQFVDSKLMFDEFHPRVLEDMANISAKLKKEGKKMKYLVIFDDCVDSKSKYQKDITNLFFNGRHYGASVIFLTQKASLLSTGWMANTMVHISLFAGSRAEKQYLAEKIISDAMDSKELQNLKMKELDRKAYALQTYTCHDYRSLVILPYEETKVYWFKAKEMKAKKEKPKSFIEKFM